VNGTSWAEEVRVVALIFVWKSWHWAQAGVQPRRQTAPRRGDHWIVDPLFLAAVGKRDP
jgi:hypothetical protein